MGMNDDMDRYLRNRKRQQQGQEQSWWTKVFAGDRKSIPEDEFPPEEHAVLRTMETEIKQGAQKEQELKAEEFKVEEEQANRVSLYQQFLRLFKREKQVEEEFAQVKEMEAEMNDPSVTDDFKKLAQIQMKVFERMPTRVREEFRESEDFKTYSEILQRRGVAKRK